VVTYAKLTLPFLPLLASLQGCNPGASNPVRAAMAEHRAAVEAPEAVVFRFAGERAADARLYVLPGLNEAAWRFRTPGLTVERMVGFSRDRDEVYLLTGSGALTTLELTTGRARVIDTNIVAAAMGSTGVVHLVRGDGSLGSVSYRSVTPWPGTLDTLPQTVWGGGAERLVALVQTARERRLVAVSAGKPPVIQRIPGGPIAVSNWGDVAVVAVDSGLVVLDPADTTRRRFRALREAPDAVGLSPSEHRIYVATADHHLLMLDRTSLDPAEQLRLPGRAGAIRVDPLGRLLLIRPASGDSIWLVDPARAHLLGTIPGSWRDDLPTVAPDGSILVAHGRNVEAYAPDSLTVAGRVADGAKDRWLAAAWDPRRPALQLAADSAAAVVPIAAGLAIYVQVGSTANEAWAQESARQLRTAGMQAGVLPPATADEPYRVVLGPYPTREAAEAAGRKLGRPFWIFMREGQEPPR
jgi:hypothetical protein